MDNKAETAFLVCSKLKNTNLISSSFFIIPFQMVKLKYAPSVAGYFNLYPHFKRFLSHHRAIFASKKLQATLLPVGSSFSSNGIGLFGAVKLTTLQTLLSSWLKVKSSRHLVLTHCSKLSSVSHPPSFSHSALDTRPEERAQVLLPSNTFWLWTGVWQVKIVLNLITLASPPLHIS